MQHQGVTSCRALSALAHILMHDTQCMPVVVFQIYLGTLGASHCTGNITAKACLGDRPMNPQTVHNKSRWQLAVVFGDGDIRLMLPGKPSPTVSTSQPLCMLVTPRFCCATWWAYTHSPCTATIPGVVSCKRAYCWQAHALRIPCLSLTVEALA